MFVDHVKVYVRGGDGGDGMVAFRREKYVPDGGPAGGDGGKGGNIIFIVEEGLRTLMDFRYKRIFKAERGTHGMSANKHGAKAEDTFIKVPPGTVVKDVETGETIADLVEHGQTAIIAKGGRGGRGNSRFATPLAITAVWPCSTKSAMVSPESKSFTTVPGGTLINVSSALAPCLLALMPCVPRSALKIRL